MNAFPKFSTNARLFLEDARLHVAFALERTMYAFDAGTCSTLEKLLPAKYYDFGQERSYRSVVSI